MQIKSRRDHELIIKIKVCSLGILLRLISVRTCQIVEEHSWQNLPIFRQEPNCAYGVRTPAEGKVIFIERCIFAMWGKSNTRSDTKPVANSDQFEMLA